MNRIKLIFIGACCALVACANKADTDPKAVITEKATARWQVRINGEKKDRLYEYIAPSLKSIVSKEVYLSKFGSILTYKDADVDKVTCDNEKELIKANACIVVVSISYITSSLGSGEIALTRPIEEKWIKEDGDWWLYDK